MAQKKAGGAALLALMLIVGSVVSSPLQADTPLVEALAETGDVQHPWAVGPWRRFRLGLYLPCPGHAADTDGLCG